MLTVVLSSTAWVSTAAFRLRAGGFPPFDGLGSLGGLGGLGGGPSGTGQLAVLLLTVPGRASQRWRRQ